MRLTNGYGKHRKAGNSMRNERNKVLQLTTVEVMMLQQALDFWRQSEDELPARLQAEIHQLQTQLQSLQFMD